MTSPSLIFERALIRRRLDRADKGGAEDFLLRAAIDDLCERLSLIKRAFPAVVEIGSASPAFSARLAHEGRLIVRMAPLAQLAAGAPQIDLSRDAGGKAESTFPRPALALVGDEEALPFADARFDLAVSALSLHTVNDLPGALIQIRRILKPDGLFLGCLLGGASLKELRSALGAAETELYGGISPRVAPFADARDMGGLLQRAGLALPVADSESLTVRYRDIFALMADLRAMGATNALVARVRKPSSRKLFLRAAEIYAERFSDPDGRVRATFELIFVSGWAPHESQQKPLRPGSATMRLEDALRREKPPPSGA
ncbi:methyltransferase domain-containing protein [Methylocella sp.]|uniref:methyltransferase domain-containing protein n=1 Tax=Methylocella sp. TaxID=1978226 RepID=UPI003C19D9AC